MHQVHPHNCRAEPLPGQSSHHTTKLGSDLQLALAAVITHKGYFRQIREENVTLYAWKNSLIATIYGNLKSSIVMLMGREDQNSKLSIVSKLFLANNMAILANPRDLKNTWYFR
jgi:hypothetical protein